MKNLVKRINNAESQLQEFDEEYWQHLTDIIIAQIGPENIEYLERSGEKLKLINKHWQQIERTFPHYILNGKPLQNAIDISGPALDIDVLYEKALGFDSKTMVSTDSNS